MHLEGMKGDNGVGERCGGVVERGLRKGGKEIRKKERYVVSERRISEKETDTE